MNELMLKNLDIEKAREITLRFTGLFNYAMYNKCEHADIEEFIKNDVEVRLEDWLNRHFKEEPFCGSVSIKSIYSVIDYSYTILEEVESVIEADVYNNAVSAIRIINTDYVTL